MPTKFAITGLWSIVLVSLVSQTQCGEISLDSVCKNQAVSLVSISETRDLIKQNQLRPQEACHKYKQSLSDLDAILIKVQTGHVCNLDMVDAIRSYHLKFIDTTRGAELARDRDEIPEPLRLFFISLCFQISAECKMNLINNLEQDTQNVILDEDYEQIRLLERHHVTLVEEEGGINDFDDILLLGDLMKAAENEQSIEQTQLVVKISTNHILRQLLLKCKNKFRPFYDKLIMPLIKLSHLGYNYQGELLERELQELQRNELIKRWYNIVQTCEMMSLIKIYEDPDRQVESNGATRGVITFIAADEEATLRRRNLKQIDENEAGETPYKYEPYPSHNDDVLWIKGQAELLELIRKHRANVSEADRIRRQLVRKVLNRVKDMILSRKILMLPGELISCHRQEACDASESSMNLDMLKMIDDAVEQEEIKEGKIEESDEQAVSAWFGGDEGRVTSRKGLSKIRKHTAVPPRPARIIPFKDQSKLSWKGFRLFRSLLPSRWTLFFWTLAILGVIMLIFALRG